LPPAILRFRVCESLSVSEFLRVGEGWASLIQRHVSEMGIDLLRSRRVLDFGCGCGRTLRWFLRDDTTAELHGVDVDADAIAWCQKHLRGNFAATTSAPPLPHPDGHFDVVYCLSVFTHLNESMQDLWLAELKRVLKPGGVLLLTVHGGAAAKALDSDSQRTLQQDGFVHKRSQKLRGLVPDWYQTTWHCPKYILNRLSAGFEDVRYCTIPDSVQDIVLARIPLFTRIPTAP
jgi:SAM-dependent methyltransferase